MVFNKNTAILLVIALLIASIGIISIYSCTYRKEGQLWQDIYKRQILWVVLGLGLFLIASHMDYRRLWDWAFVLYALAVFFLLLVVILGITRLGAQRWLKIGAFHFQPSEFAKIVTIIFLARYYTVSREGLARSIGIPFAFIFLPMGLIIRQPDLGSGLLVLFIFIAVLFVAQVRMRHLLLLGVFLAASIPLLWQLLRDYQKERLLVFMNPDMDPLGAGYTIVQSKIAIGSGGLFGKGWLAGTQSQLHFLPESHTDFIFATFTEQWGLLGSVFLLILYYGLLSQAFGIGQRSHDQFGRILAHGIMFMIAVQMAINIAMNMGLAPVVGIPLPLMSYGGSSVLITFFCLGILASISRRRTVF
ncbi:MAG: rod shape-determining protein RodA [Candidatus Omnitrophica bacterium]|nr:rod shape-determining protein RodA [Candidatus Omnitrophota bacterium]